MTQRVAWNTCGLLYTISSQRILTAFIYKTVFARITLQSSGEMTLKFGLIHTQKTNSCVYEYNCFN